MSTNEATQAWDGLMELLSYDRDLTDAEVLDDTPTETPGGQA